MTPSPSDRPRRGDGQPLAATILFLLPFFSFKPNHAIPAEKAHMASQPGGSSSVIVPVLPAWSWRGVAGVGYQDPCLGDDDKGDRLELQVLLSGRSSVFPVPSFGEPEPPVPELKRPVLELELWYLDILPGGELMVKHCILWISTTYLSIWILLCNIQSQEDDVGWLNVSTAADSRN
ncbi:hypothetical protein BHM03_00007689 [Ensete ventricosum]|nr:hypothetical protein BHM03_00007689 [Ensete ventricosum]